LDVVPTEQQAFLRRALRWLAIVGLIVGVDERDVPRARGGLHGG
jgi:hypothetical protein